MPRQNTSWSATKQNQINGNMQRHSAVSLSTSGLSAKSLLAIIARLYTTRGIFIERSDVPLGDGASSVFSHQLHLSTNQVLVCVAKLDYATHIFTDRDSLEIPNYSFGFNLV